MITLLIMVYCFTLFSFLMVIIKYHYYKVNCSTDVKTESDYTIVPLILSSPNTFLIFIKQQRHINAICSVITSNSAIKPLFCFISILNSSPPHPKHRLAEYSILIGRWEGRGCGVIISGSRIWDSYFTSLKLCHINIIWQLPLMMGFIWIASLKQWICNAVGWSFVITFESYCKTVALLQ